MSSVCNTLCWVLGGTARNDFLSLFLNDLQYHCKEGIHIKCEEQCMVLVK